MAATCDDQSILHEDQTSLQPKPTDEPKYGVNYGSLTQETPKVVFRISRLAALWYGAVHIFPVIITLLVLGLRWKNVYWSDLGAKNQNIILNVFQFASKAHEILIGFSLSAIILQRIQVGLIETQGIPLGFVTAPYRLSSIDYLISKEFWGSITTKWYLLGLLTALACVLSALVGPSSAIATILQSDWWPVAKPFGADSEALYMNISSNDLWPLVLDSSDCKYHTNEFCPSAGLSTIWSWAAACTNQGHLPNFIMQADGGVERYLTSQTSNKN